MREVLTLPDVYRLLTDACKRAGSQSAFAAREGMSAAFVSAVLNAKKAPSARLLNILGLRQVTRFVPIRPWSALPPALRVAAAAVGCSVGDNPPLRLPDSGDSGYDVSCRADNCGQGPGVLETLPIPSTNTVTLQGTHDDG